ncbi:hypothetical protein [Stenotrophomonas maltophilia]
MSHPRTAGRRADRYRGGSLLGLVLLIAGCSGAAEQPAAVVAAPANRVSCPNLTFDLPQGWRLEPQGALQWRLVPPRASSFNGMLVCWQAEYSADVLLLLRDESDRLLGWSAQHPKFERRIERWSDEKRDDMGDPRLIACETSSADSERLQTCMWGDPYPRLEQRADGFIAVRWTAPDPVADELRRELAASVLSTFSVTPTPERPNDQHP